ncbi:MAG TPA: VWA domain-containing protein [Vicinamibacteria bacterium]|jgi:VWFA-related protein
MAEMAQLVAFLLFLAQTSAPAQTRTVKLVATDEKGTPIEFLAIEDVALLENGVARPITSLERDQRPLTVAVIVDSSEPMGTIFRLHVVEGVLQLLRRLPEGTRFAVWTTGDRPTKVVDYTTEVSTTVTSALRRVAPMGGNTLLDAIVEATDDLKAEEGRRTAMVVVTGLGIGFANRSRQAVVEKTQDKLDTFLAVAFEDGRGPVNAPDREETGPADYEYVLSNLARRTGGDFQSILSAMGVPQALQKVASELRGQYRLTYATVPDLKSRKLEVHLARPGVKARVVAGADAR